MYPILLSIGQVPQALRELRQWLLWRWELHDGRWTKVPYTIAGFRASSTDPRDWNDLRVLLAFLRDHPQFASGVGFVVTVGDPFCGIDLDDSLTDTGCTKPWVRLLLCRFADCYTEVTPGGGGLRIWCRAVASRGLGKQVLPDGSIEVYSAGRYFTFTGAVFGDAPLLIPAGHQADVDAIIAHFAPARRARSTNGSNAASSDSRVTFGERHSKFVAIAGALRRQGAGEETIRAAITAFNANECDPPKSEYELEEDLHKIWRSAERW
jgi:primase-polymerase (primpol)-like protein